MHEMKICTTCGTHKVTTAFSKDPRLKSGLASRCKECMCKKAREYHAKHPETKQIWVANHREQVNRSNRKRMEGHREENRKRFKEWWNKQNPEYKYEKAQKWNREHPEYHKEWEVKNPEKRKLYSDVCNAKIRATVKGKLNQNLSRSIRASIAKDSKANRHWETLVSFTIDQLKSHLEKKFKPGWTWDNYGKVWNIDHKIPIAVFNFESPEDIDFRLCWSLKNLQPLESRENFRKSDKVDKPFQPSLAIQVNRSAVNA